MELVNYGESIAFNYRCMKTGETWTIKIEFEIWNNADKEFAPFRR